MKDHATHRVDRLKASSRDVLAILRMSEAPLSAYQILEKAGSPKLKTPVQVYRALKTLTRLALVHRVETLSKYVACRCDHPQGAQPILAICDACGTVAELPDTPPMQRLEEMVAGGGFACRLIKVEVAGLCQSCQAEASV
jgi:Fur family zinc uptake transcriptional regulator